MKLFRTRITTIAIGLVAASMFYSNAASAAPTHINNLSNATQAEEVAVDVYDKLSSTANPQLAYEKLTVDERGAFDRYFLPAEAEEVYALAQVNADGGPLSTPKTFTSKSDAMKAVAAAETCWIGTSKYTMKAALGNALWDTWTEGRWCGNGSTVTSATFTRSWATIAALGWRDDGEIGSGQGIAGGEARMWSQRKMILGVGGWDVQNQQPCNRLNGSASGGTSFTESCSIV